MIGFYSLFQYTGDARRLEAVNVGVVLMCPEAKFFEAKFLDEAHIIEATKHVPGDFERHAILASLQTQTAAAWLRQMATEHDHTKELLISFGERLCNEVHITAPRRIALDEPAQELAALFQGLVMRAPKAKRTREKALKSHIYDAVNERKLGNRIRKNYEMMLPIVHQCRSFPLMYRNGSTSLVETISPKRSNAPKFIDEILRLKALGEEVLQIKQDEDGKHLRMDLVFDCEESSNEQILREALRDHMRLIPKDNMEILLEDISHAQVWRA